ncbi:MAG: hypothetical protein ACYCSQ_00415 [bacterium]
MCEACGIPDMQGYYNQDDICGGCAFHDEKIAGSDGCRRFDPSAYDADGHEYCRLYRLKGTLSSEEVEKNNRRRRKIFSIRVMV